MAIAAAAMLAVLLALVTLLHLPAVRSRTLSWVIATLEARYDLLLGADRLSYNLVTGRVTLTNVRLAARGFVDQPFFTAAQVSADLPLAAYTGRLILDDVEVERGRVAIVVNAAGVSNLPGGADDAPPPAEGRALALHGLHLHDFAFSYDDPGSPLRIGATGIDMALDPAEVPIFGGASGPFAVRGGVDLQWRDRVLRIEPIESRLSFDGRNVSVEDLPLATSMGGVSVSGRLNRVLDALSLELGFDGQLDVARAAEWAPPPVPVAGTARVRGTVTGPPEALEIVTRFDAPSLTVGAEADLTASGELLIDSDRLIANRLIASPRSGGEVNAAIDVPFGDAGLSMSATWQGVDARALARVANVAPPAVATRLDGTARFTGGAERVLTLETDLTAVQEQGMTPLAGRLRAGVKGDAWTLTHELRADGVSVSGEAEGRLNADDLSRSTLAGPSTVVIASLASADRMLSPHGIRIPAAIRESSGAIRAEATLSGTFADPHAMMAAEAPQVEIPGVGVASLQAGIEADRRLVHIAPLTIARDGTEASGELNLHLSERTLSGHISASVPDAGTVQAAVPEQWRVSGALTAEATVGGTFDAPTVDVAVAGPSLTFAGDSFEALDARLHVTDEGIDVSSLDVQQDEGGRLHATGRYGFDRTYTADLELTAMTWSGVLVGEAESRATLNGRFSGRGSLDRPLGDGRFNVAITGGLAGDLVGEGTVNVSLLGEIARGSVVIPSLGSYANATIATEAPYDYRAVAVIDRLDIARLVPLVDATPGQLTGRLDATAAVNGALGRDAPPQVQANLQQLDARLGGVPLVLLAPAAIAWQPGELTVRHFTATLGSGTLTAEGTRADRAGSVFSSSYRGEVEDLTTAGRAFGLDADVVARGWLVAEVYDTGKRDELIASAALTDGYIEAADGVYFTHVAAIAGLNGEQLALHALSGRVDTATAGGSFAGKGAATIPGLDPMRATGSFALDSATFDSAGVEVKQSRPTTISVDNGLVTMDDVVWEAAGSALALGGSVDLSRGTPALNLSVRGKAVLRALSAFIPSLGVDGTADVDVRVGGTTASPDLSGSVTLDDAEIALRSPRIVISELSGPIVLNGDRIELRGLTGSANGGSLTIDGGVVLRGTQIVDGEVYVQAAGLAVEYPQGLRSEVDALLTYEVGGAAPLLSGDVRVQRSSFSQPISLAALARANSSATVRPLNGDSALDTLRLNINVTTVEDLRVDNNYGRFEGGAQLRIVGTAGQPGMSGQVTLREGGRIYAAGRTFTLSRGTISFTDLNRIRPDLDIQAVTRVANLGDVTMTLQGTPDRFEFELSSEENASQEEIATALLGGGATGVNALTLLSTDILGSTGRQLGLDALRIDRGDVVRDEFREDPSALVQDENTLVTRLTLSKRIRDNVEFTLSQNLAENGKTTFVVSYYPLTNLELRAISRDDGSQGLGIRHQLTFGGETVTRSAAPRVELTVSEVRLEGTLAPFAEEELRKQLKVKPGDTFDYYEWQEDLDELAARYVESGHYEARVRGRREPAGENTVRAIYVVVPGPPTRIQVDGFEVPADDLEAIREAWAGGVFDRFIVQDAQSRVQQALLARGYVNGSVSGTMESSGAVRTLRLTVVPGELSGGRGMRFTGNTGVSRNELEAWVQMSALEADGWIYRDLLAQTLTGFYKSEGYLGATVRVEAPAIENGEGVLPVVISEGPRATIREIQWAGLSDAQRVATERAAGLESGAPYTLPSLNAARERVDRHFRTLGHNAVEVAATATPLNEGQQVDLHLVVTEGPQQVLQEVETLGATRTRAGVVSRALHLPIGRPVNFGEWALARKRLFDTNVFRSVDIQAVPIGDAEGGVQQVRAVVTVEEYPSWRFRYGFQVDRDRDDDAIALETDDIPSALTVGAIGEIRNQNLFGRAVTGGAAARVERDFQRLNTFLQTASFFGLPLRSGLYLFTSRENIRVDGDVFFVDDKRGLSVEQRWRRRRGFEITYGYRFEQNHTYDPEPDPQDDFPLDQRVDVGSLTGAFLFDRRNDPVSAATGTFSAISFERAASWLASDTSFTKLLLQQYGFWSVGPVVLASRVIAGRATGGDLPLDERFLVGGATTVRGYAENALGPRDIFGETLGGTQLLVLNQEVRFPLVRWFRGVGFVDVGNVFDPRSPFAWSELKIGYGAGLRLDSPVGLLRLDFGIPGSTIPNSGRQPNTLGAGRWYFGIGHVF